MTSIEQRRGVVPNLRAGTLRSVLQPSLTVRSTSESEIEESPTENPIPAGGLRAESIVLVNTGDGKGKSSAAFGVMVRALAMDWRVAVVQFIKSGDWKVGEEKIGRQLGVAWHAMGEGFTWDSDDISHDVELAKRGWHVAADLIASGQYHLVVLDEITYLLNWGWLEIDDVLHTITERPSHVNIVCTGRDAPQALIDIADTATEMHKIKHAYDSGILAKKGIDY